MNLNLQPKRAVAASEYRLPGSTERVVARNGEINAYDRKDALQTAMSLQQAVARGDVDLDGRVLAAEERRRVSASHRELLTAAANDSQLFRQIGETMANEIYMTTNRKGFARRFLKPMTLKQGDIPRFPVRMKNVHAFYVSGPSKIETQVVTDKWLYPVEGIIETRPFIPQVELNQSSTDVLEEKAIEALEGIMVSEDRYWYQMAQATIGIDNNRALIAGSLSPSALMDARQKVVQWGLKAAYCLMASDLFVDIVGDSSFIQQIEPVARHELVMTGEMAVLYGMTLISESYRHPEHKVLEEGEFIVVSDPDTHGAYADRGGVESQPIDGSYEKRAGRGWRMTESWCAAIANNRSVCVARRI